MFGLSKKKSSIDKATRSIKEVADHIEAMTDKAVNELNRLRTENHELRMQLESVRKVRNDSAEDMRAEISSLRNQLLDRDNDSERLDWLESVGTHGVKWICRPSTTGRGYRLHQDPKGGEFNTAREAIDDARNGATH